MLVGGEEKEMGVRWPEVEPVAVVGVGVEVDFEGTHYLFMERLKRRVRYKYT